MAKKLKADMRASQRGTAMGTSSQNMLAACLRAILPRLALALLLLALPCSCQQADSRQIGKGLGGLSGGQARDYRYVADMHRMLYWRNTPANVRKVPKDSRVYILDDESLAQFAGYRRGD